MVSCDDVTESRYRPFPSVLLMRVTHPQERHAKT
jgi:hypothetical protein